MTLRIENFAEWLACGERGESSNAIVARVTRVFQQQGRSWW
jgi:hypothetical protein